MCRKVCTCTFEDHSAKARRAYNARSENVGVTPMAGDPSSRRPHQAKGGHGPRPCGPCGAFAGSRQPRSGGHNHQRRRRTLEHISFASIVKVKCQNIRFSPVWLYMCVCSELGRVNRLSQILHLCFFCEEEETFELNWPIIDCGAGGRLPPSRPLGRGSVRDAGISTDSPAEL